MGINHVEDSPDDEGVGILQIVEWVPVTVADSETEATTEVERLRSRNIHARVADGFAVEVKSVDVARTRSLFAARAIVARRRLRQGPPWKYERISQIGVGLVVVVSLVLAVGGLVVFFILFLLDGGILRPPGM